MSVEHDDIMSNDGLIDDIIGLRVTSNGTIDGDDDQDDDVLLTNDDVISELREAIMSMKMTIETQDKRIAKLELEVDALRSNEMAERPRATASMPLPYAMKHTSSPAFRRRRTSNTADDDTESFSAVSRVRSDVSAPASTSAANSYMNRGPNTAVFSVTNPMTFKNSSAISSRGYDNKLSLWGTVFASLMIACMTKYIQKTGQTGHIIDSAMVAKTYTRIVGDLYHRVKFADLPAVQSHEVALLSKIFKRTKKDEVPESYPSTWLELRNNTDGNACMSVIESIFMAAKMVPEAMMHPMSRLITAMDQPVLVVTPKGPTFAIPGSTRIEMTPTGIERFCSWLKKDSLRTYVKLRLNGDSEITAMNRMMQSMKDTEMFDNKNLYKGRSLIGEMIGQTS